MTNESDIVYLTEINFKKEVLDSRQPVLVIFRAEWYGTAHIMAPMIKKLAAAYRKKLKIGMLDIEENRCVTQQYGIQDILTFLLFKNGQVKWRFAGVTSRDFLEYQIQLIL